MQTLQPDLSGNPFFAEEFRNGKKRLGTEGGNRCHKEQ